MMAGTYKNSLVLEIQEPLFKGILSDIRRTVHSEIPQPIVVVGVDGSGKTTLLRRLYHEVVESGEPAVWIDGRSVFSVKDITTRGDILPNTVVFIDNVDFFFNRCSYEEQYVLRSYLYNEGAPMMIGSVEKLLPAFSDYRAPFFEGLKFVHIPSVNIEEVIQSLFVTQEERNRAKTILSLLPKTISSIKIARNIIRDNGEPGKDIAILIQEFSPQYRLLYHSLPTYSQHILFAIGNTPAPGLLLSEIKDATKLPTSVLSIYLRNLSSTGILTADKRVKKGYRYMIKDPLFGEWLAFNELNT